MITLWKIPIEDLCLFLDYDQTGQANNEAARYPEKQGKRKKKPERAIGNDPNLATEEAAGK